MKLARALAVSVAEVAAEVRRAGVRAAVAEEVAEVRKEGVAAAVAEVRREGVAEVGREGVVAVVVEVRREGVGAAREGTAVTGWSRPEHSELSTTSTAAAWGGNTGWARILATPQFIQVPNMIHDALNYCSRDRGWKWPPQKLVKCQTFG